MAQYSNNPRENFHISMMERQKNRTTPLTVEDFLKQMGGLNSMGVTAEQLQQRFNEKPLENTSNPSMLGQKLTDEDIKQMYDNWKPYGSGDVKSNPAAEAKISALNIPDRGQPPQGMQAVDNSVISAPKASGGNYKDGQVVTQNGIRYIAHGGKLLTQAEVVKDKNLFNKYSNLVSNKEIGNANGAAPPKPDVDKPPAPPEPDVDKPKAIGPKSNNIYSQGQVVTSNGKRYVYNAKASSFVSEDEIKANPQKYPNFAKTLGIGAQTTGNTIDTSKDPNNLPYNNPESNKPILPTSYSGQISLPTDPYEMQLMDFLKKQFEDKTWENKYGELQKQYQELADRPDKYSGMIEKAGGEDVAGYIKSLYEGSADPLRREAQRMQEQNQADLASRGLGMSTVVNDVNSGVQRELMANLGDLSNKANVQGRDMYLNALKSAADVYGQMGAQQGNVLNAMQTNIGNQMGAQQIGLANINDILAKQEARRLTNMQTGINQWDKDVANYWKYMYYPIDAYAGQNSTANTAAQVGTNQYNQATSNAATQNQTAGNVGSMLAQNMFKQPQNTSWQPISQQQAQTSLINAGNAAKKIPFGGQIS